MFGTPSSQLGRRDPDPEQSQILSRVFKCLILMEDMAHAVCLNNLRHPIRRELHQATRNHSEPPPGVVGFPLLLTCSFLHGQGMKSKHPGRSQLLGGRSIRSFNFMLISLLVLFGGKPPTKTFRSLAKFRRPDTFPKPFIIIMGLNMGFHTPQPPQLLPHPPPLLMPPP